MPRDNEKKLETLFVCDLFLLLFHESVNRIMNKSMIWGLSNIISVRIQFHLYFQISEWTKDHNSKFTFLAIQIKIMLITNIVRQIISAQIPSEVEREEQHATFYHGASFPALARILLYNVALNWLACFSASSRLQLYDSFFLKGPACEILEVLVCGLGATGLVEDVHLNTVCSNIERLLVLFLIKNEGAYKMALEFGNSYGRGKFPHLFPQRPGSTSALRISQILASVPDKARPESPDILSSHIFFKNIVLQLLSAAYEMASQLRKSEFGWVEASYTGSFAFIGETFAKICRRGSADVLVLVSAPMILDHIQICITSKFDSSVSDQIESKSESFFWFLLLEEMKDSYAVERFSEVLLRWLPTQNIEDEEAYWILWMLFHRTFKAKAATRAIFSEKFLMWKVFPVRCLKWILQFSVFEECPSAVSETSKRNSQRFLEIIQSLIGSWSKRDFIQSTPVEEQAYLTAAIGLSLERMSKEELESTKDILHSILAGVSSRLESPDHLVRKMASSIALVFSRIIDPKKPLYLDDNFGDVIDWEFGQKSLSSVSLVEMPSKNGSAASTIASNSYSNPILRKKKDNKLECGDHIDPDEVIDPAVLYNESFRVHRGFSEDESISGSSEGSWDSSLDPYDLTDDYTDLEKKFSQLGDVVTALRKPDDLDSVEKALNAVEGLVRASPDELPHCAGDLVSSLIRLRCSDISVEGEEESAEERRQQSLVALLVMCPFESLAILNKLIYSSNVDTAQRILILDTMNDAAQELAAFKMESKRGHSELISPIFEKQPWFLPKEGPAGTGPWKEVSKNSLHLNWSSHSYERELPSKPGPKKGTSRRWSQKTAETLGSHGKETLNRFPLYAASFMLPAMEGFDKKRHGVDLLGRDFIVLGKLVYMLGTCMRCIARHPEASSLAPALLDFLTSRDISHHSEAYVRRSVLYALGCILVALHPSYVASAVIEGNKEISNGLDWIRSWALKIAESDPNSECSTMAIKCLQLHAEMALQTSRVLESTECSSLRSGSITYKTNDIILPF